MAISGAASRGAADGDDSAASLQGLEHPLLHAYEARKDDPAAAGDREAQRFGPEADGGASFVRTCFNGLNALSGECSVGVCNLAAFVCQFVLPGHGQGLLAKVLLFISGVGLLSIPYALSEGGWLSLALLLVVAAVCCYTGLLLQRCMDASPAARGYPEIGELAFGRGGRLAASAFLYAELYLVAIGFLILEGDNLDKLFPGTSLGLALGGGRLVVICGKQLFVVLVALVILPTTWLRSLGVLAYVSASGVLASAVVVVCVLWTAVADGVGFRAQGRMINVSGLPTALGLYTFCYCGHAIFPTLCNSMKEKKKFSRVSSNHDSAVFFGNT
jgi:solute carrier family 32 (vesicular inhibitory amino acid transporter)